MSGNKVFSNLIWRFAERIGVKLITTIVSLILARILAPELFGTVTIVLVITDILQVFVESGFGTALIQKKDADDLDFSSVFFFNIVICIVLYLALFFAAPWISRFYKKDELTPIIRVVGIILIVAGVRNVQQAFVSRNMLFRRFFFSTLGGTVSGAIVGISMALAGFGVWAYVAQYLVNNIVGTVILWLTVKWRPKRQFSFERLKGLFSYGWKLLVSSVLNTLSDKLRQLVIGYQYDSSSLSFYNYGVVFPNLIVENVNTSIDSVLLPALSAEQDSKTSVKSMTKRAVRVSSYIMWPLMLGLFAVSGPLVQLLLGEAWMPCVPFVRIFCIYYALFPIHTANLNAIKAVGRSDIFLKLEIIKKILDFAVVLGTMFIGVEAMALGLLAEGVVNLLINSVPNSRLIDYPFSEQISDIIPSVILAAVMCAAALPISFLGLGSLITLIIQIAVGCLVYIGGSVILKIDTFTYVMNIAKGLIHRS
ncbi:MAG: lipopolysaccharide biosynthesis protein [Eubacteriales bacterium]|nr:lipopolysaccharide biosynthesis protein [Eubacteriales bacterium]